MRIKNRRIKVIKNYIFDFGNVLGQFYPEQFVAHYISDEETIKF